VSERRPAAEITLIWILLRLAASVPVAFITLFLGVSSFAGVLHALGEWGAAGLGWALAWGLVGLITLAGAAGALFLIWIGPARARVTRRRRRGQCVHCGYPRSEGAVCTECGADPRG
jgi:hypothetical protein